MKLSDMNFLMSAISGFRTMKWNKEILKAFLFGLTVGSYLVFAALRYIEDRTEQEIEENLNR